MLEDLLKYVVSRDPHELGRDTLDLLITYYIFYRIALVLKGTRAIQIVFGLAAVFVLYLVAQFLNLNTVLTLLSAVLQSAILIGVVVFQNDIRRGLIRVGARARLGSGQTLEGKVIDQVVEAATTLARHRTGAIITFEQDANLDEFVGSNTGQTVDAAVSSELLVSLFIPEAMNKLHDGAVVIRDLRIAKAGVFFPMPESKVADESFGSRHRAAMGITEETDAVVVVVSEERGSISFCFNGNIIPNLDGPKLRAALEAVFVKKRKKAPAKATPFWSRLIKRVTERPPPLAPAKKPTRPKTDVAPLRKKKDATPDELLATLRKKKDELDEKIDSQRGPAPLRKKKSGDKEAQREAPRHSSNPPPAISAGDSLRTPLRHLAPAPDSSGPVTRSDPPRPMPAAARTPSIPPPPPASALDLGEESPPLSTRIMPARPMPEAGGTPSHELTGAEDRTPNRPSNAFGAAALDADPSGRKGSDA